MADLNGLYREGVVNLRDRMLPFWSRLKDEERGGFYSLVTDDLEVHKDADRGCILNSRILWFFSSAYRSLHEESALEDARHAFRYLKEVFWDHENGGLYWSVKADGTPLRTDKYCFCQAFGICALAAYAEAEDLNDALSIRDSQETEASMEALRLAYELFDLIESKMRDTEGYLEAFDRELNAIPNDVFSVKGVQASRTMNTALQLLEAYMELYRADGATRVKKRLFAILDIFLDRIYLRSKTRLGVYFDLDYRPLLDLYSYGHDIECAWIIDRALSLLGDYPREKELRVVTENLTAAVYRQAYLEDGNFGSLPIEAEKGVDKDVRVWWVQAEAVNGFLNGVQVAMENNDMKAVLRYAKAVGKIWAFISSELIDPRSEGEWFSEIRAGGFPDHTKNIVDEWKCPYHNGRMFMEFIRRLNPEEDEK